MFTGRKIYRISSWFFSHAFSCPTFYLNMFTQLNDLQGACARAHTDVHSPLRKQKNSLQRWWTTVLRVHTHDSCRAGCSPLLAQLARGVVSLLTQTSPSTSYILTCVYLLPVLTSCFSRFFNLDLLENVILLIYLIISPWPNSTYSISSNFGRNNRVGRKSHELWANLRTRILPCLSDATEKTIFENRDFE